MYEIEQRLEDIINGKQPIAKSFIKEDQLSKSNQKEGFSSHLISKLTIEGEPDPLSLMQEQKSKTKKRKSKE